MVEIGSEGWQNASFLNDNWKLLFYVSRCHSSQTPEIALHYGLGMEIRGEFILNPSIIPHN